MTAQPQQTLPSLLPLSTLIGGGGPLIEVVAQPISVVGDGTKELVPTKRLQRAYVIGVRRLRERRCPADLSRKLLDVLQLAGICAPSCPGS